MSMEAHLVELKRRHSDLDRKISDATAHPSADTLEIAKLKRKKLTLKDQINRMSLMREH